VSTVVRLVGWEWLTNRRIDHEPVNMTWLVRYRVMMCFVSRTQSTPGEGFFQALPRALLLCTTARE